VSFFLFWALCAASSAFTLFLSLTPPVSERPESALDAPPPSRPSGW
jgi:hypothetical protein